MPEHFIIKEKRILVPHICLTELAGNSTGMEAPGQYGFILEPFSAPIMVADWQGNSLTVVCDDRIPAGEKLVAMSPGSDIIMETGLGNGFRWECGGLLPALIGSGAEAGVLLGLGRRLVEGGRMPTAILEAETAEQVVFKDELIVLGVDVFVATLDGSAGMKGSAGDVLEAVGGCSCVYVSGTESLIRQIFDRAGCGGEYDLFCRMASETDPHAVFEIQTAFRKKDLFRDGPVLPGGDLIFPEV